MASSKNIATKALANEEQVVGRTRGRLGRDEEIEGGSAADLIEGERGDDSIEAGNGADTVDGGKGSDLLIGAGNRDETGDTYVLSLGDDTIDGYKQAIHKRTLTKAHKYPRSHHSNG